MEQSEACTDLSTHTSVKSDVQQLSVVLAWFEQFHLTHFPHERWLQANAALVEGFTNAVRHAHFNRNDMPEIEMSVALSQSRLQMKIWDYGPPFELEVALEALRIEVEDPEYSPLDRGQQFGSIMFLKLVDQHGWTISYQQDGDGRNCFSASCVF